MPVVLHQFGAGAAASVHHLVAWNMARLCVEQYHFNLLPGPGGGIAAMSCWAAAATVANGAAGFPQEHAVNAAGPLGATGGPLGYGAVFGNSRMAAIAAAVAVPGMPAAGFSSHAERNALVTAGANGLALYTPIANQAVVFVQLAPCPGCANWLGGGGGGLPNPWGPAILGGALTLHVWYRWAYNPAGVGQMMAFNNLTRAAKLAQTLTAAWGP